MHKKLAVNTAILFFSIIPQLSFSQGACMSVYSPYFNCTANGYINNAYCNNAIKEFENSNCRVSMCNATYWPNDTPPAYLNCQALPVNTQRYDSCMSSGLGSGRSFQTPEEFCREWAGAR
jgi:hypothetical protein